MGTEEPAEGRLAEGPSLDTSEDMPAYLRSLKVRGAKIKMAFAR